MEGIAPVMKTIAIIALGVLAAIIIGIIVADVIERSGDDW